MGGMKITNVLAALPVRDLDAAVRWFEELVGVGPTARPMDGLAEGCRCSRTLSGPGKDR
jgi:hypothetical protein